MLTPGVWLPSGFRPGAEASPAKAAVNALLAGMAAAAPSRRCFVLDGPACGTVKALRAGGRGRLPADIVVPNVVTASYEAIAAAGECTPFHGSARLCIEELATPAGGGLPAEVSPSARFGLVFLDYCCRLDAGPHRLEKSPIADVKELFKRRLPDPAGCVLALTLADDPEPAVDAEPRPPAPERLAALVAEAAAAAGLECCRREGLRYAGGRDGTSSMFVEVFGLGAAAAALAAGPRPPPAAPEELPYSVRRPAVPRLRVVLAQILCSILCTQAEGFPPPFGCPLTKTRDPPANAPRAFCGCVSLLMPCRFQQNHAVVPVRRRCLGCGRRSCGRPSRWSTRLSRATPTRRHGTLEWCCRPFVPAFH